MAIEETSERLHAEIARLRAQLSTLEARADATKPHWFDRATDAIFVTDANWHITDWNPAAEQLYGWPRAEVIGLPLWDIILPVRYLDGTTDDSATETLLQNGLWRGMFVQHTRAGDERVIEGSTRAIVDDQGAISGYIAINHDVTARVAAEAALKVSEERFRAIIENGVEGIVLIGDNRHPRYVSPTITTLLGYPLATFAMLRANDLCHPDDLPQFSAFITTLTTKPDATAEVTVRLRHQDGSWRWMELHGIDQIRNPAIAAIIVSLHNVNERVAAQAALAAEHQRIVQLKNEFMATMSHELRTPLNAVIGHSQLLIEETYGPLSERQQGAVRSIDASGRHLLVLINDILDYTKFESGKVALGIDMTAVPSLCYGCVRMIAASARQKKIRIVTVLDSAVSIIQADGKRLQQILLNLLVNAVKFTPDGGEIGLEVHGDAANQQVVFTVWDTGIGIEAVDFPQLFQPFVQVDSALSRKYEGTGLGLALVRRLAEAHSGSVSVASTPGQGSRFSVTLPWNAPLKLPDPPAAMPQPLPAPAAAPGRPTQTILLAEDNQSNAQVTRDMVESQGYRLVVAATGNEALALAREARPALILMDIQLPGMSGIEAIQAIRADAELRQIPIIALTALAMPGDRERCLQAGADDYLSKPVSLKALLASIAAQLERQATPPSSALARTGDQ